MSDDELMRTRLRIGGWLPSYESAGRRALPERLVRPGTTVADGARRGRSGRAEPTDEEVRAGARTLSWRRRAFLAGLTGAAALTLLLFASIQQAGVAPATLGEPSVGAVSLVQPPWPVAPVTDSPSPSLVPSTAASPSAAERATATAGGKPAAPDRSPSGRGAVTPAGPATTRAAASLTSGSRVGLEPVGRPGYRVRHRDFAGRVDPIGPGSSALDRADATFTVRTGLAASGCVSLESVNYPGYYLRHRNFTMYLHRRDGTRLFAEDATFCVVRGRTADGVSLRAYNYPSHYLRHRDTRLYIGDSSSGGGMAFAVRPGL